MNNIKELKKSATAFRAVSHPLRQRIIDLLKVKDCCVTEVYSKLHIDQSVASQHLILLRKAGVVSSERRGKYVYYSLIRPKYNEIVSVSKLLGR